VVVSVVAVFLLLGVAIGIFAALRIEMQAPTGGVVSPSGALECSQQNHDEYARLLDRPARLGIAFNNALQDDAALARMLAAFDALALDGPETVVVAGERSSAELYVSVCATSQCTLEEVTRAEMECMEDNMANFGNGCAYLAIRFDGKNYCMIAPESE
jgi:hypothetical protein